MSFNHRLLEPVDLGKPCLCDIVERPMLSEDAISLSLGRFRAKS